MKGALAVLVLLLATADLPDSARIQLLEKNAETN
jgi:hypothetical protein